MGTTTSAFPIFGDDGAQDEKGLVLGTYLHGLFHNDNFRSVLYEYLHSRHSQWRQHVRHKALSLSTTSQRAPHSDYDADPFDALARVVQQYVDMEALYSIIGL